MESDTIMSDHLQELKEILIEDLGADVVAMLTDDNIRQFSEVLNICAEILYSRSKNGFIADQK